MFGPFKPQNRDRGVRSRFARTRPPGGSSSSLYPTLSDPAKQLAWIDPLNLSYTDAANTARAVAGDLVRSIKLPSGWDLLSPGGSVTQATSGRRPTLRSDGMQPDGTSSCMQLPAATNLTDFTIVTLTSRTAATQFDFPIIGGAATFSGQGMFRWTDNNCYWSGNTFSDNLTGLQMIWSRRSGTTLGYKRNGLAEMTLTYAPNVQTDFIIGDGVVGTSNTNSRFVGLTIYSGYVTPASADGLAIIAAWQAIATAAGLSFTGP